MTVTSLTQLAGGQSAALGKTNSNLALSIARLASGNRLSQASTDIAALSIATGLSTQVSSLRQASLNIAQASSFLQVADGGAQQIGDILDRMSALSVQANSGILNDANREALNTEFQGLAAEIDRLAGNTNFNGVSLLNGSLSSTSAVSTNSGTGAQASGNLTFTANVAGGQTINLNGVSLVAGVDFAVGGTAAQTAQNLATSLNADSRFDGFSFDASGNNLAIEADVAGEAGNQFTINQAASTAGASFVVGGDALTGAGVFSLQGGTNDGLSSGDTSVSGTVGNNLVTGLNNQAAQSTITFGSSADIVAGNTLQIDNGEGGFTTFTFVNGAPASATDIQIGSSLEETLQNTASTLENFSGAGDFGTRQLDFSVDGNSLVIQSENAGNPLDVSGAALDLNLGTAGGSITNTTLNNGSTGGVDVSNVTSSGFTGQIQGFEASFTGVANQVQLSVQVGNDTFTATVNNTNSAANNTVTFTSENGGSFDVTLSGGNGSAVNSQADANNFATRLDAAFSTLEFSQQREVTSFNGTGDLVGASFELNSQDFSGLNVQDVTVTAGGTSSLLEVNINGQIFRSDDLGQSIGAGERITLTGSNGDTLTFTNGENEINLGNNTDARNFEEALARDFGVAEGSGGATFQVGSGADDSVELSIGNLSTSALFNGQSLDILSLSGAQAAFSAIGSAINSLTAQRANIGSFQEALDFTSANVDSAIQNQDAARSVLADTDFAEESTLYASLTVQARAGIAALAQTNRLSGNLLQLLGG
jgi:flagellin